MKYLLAIVISIFVSFLQGQIILNGDFENNLATSDIINLSNADCNQKIKYLNSFGSYGDIDIINSAAYGGRGAPSGKWYIGMTGGSTDIIALRLSAPLVIGRSYTMSFYARKTSTYQSYPIQIGLSKSNDDVGTPIYTSPQLTTTDVWTQYNFTFNASLNAEYITVHMPSGNLYDWINLDNFTFINNSKCPETLTVLSSAETVTLGTSATFTAVGGTNIKWSNYETLSYLCDNAVSARPLETTVYTVTSHQKDCPVLTATVLLTVTKPEEKTRDSVIVIRDTSSEEAITAKIKHKRKLFASHRVNGRRFTIQESVSVSDSHVKLFVWDKNRVDGDRVSLYVNGELIEENFIVTKTKKEISLNLEPGKNIIVLHALNLGKIPPNTSAMSISDGSKAKIVTIVSDLKKSGALEIIYDPLVLNK